MDGIKERLRAITPEPEGHILLHKGFTGLSRDDASQRVQYCQPVLRWAAVNLENLMHGWMGQ